MAAKVKYLITRDGRFHARIVVPKPLSASTSLISGIAGSGNSGATHLRIHTRIRTGRRHAKAISNTIVEPSNLAPFPVTERTANTPLK